MSGHFGCITVEDFAGDFLENLAGHFAQEKGGIKRQPKSAQRSGSSKQAALISSVWFCPTFWHEFAKCFADAHLQGNQRV